MFTFKDYALIVLASAFIFSIYEIFRLKKVVKKKEEQIRDGFVPVLLIEIDQRESVMYLKNENSCHVKDIEIEDLLLTLGCDFKTQLTLKFDAISLLDPMEKVQLKFRVFDKEYEVASSELKKLIPRMEQESFEIHMKYSNVQNTRFEAILFKDKGDVSIKKIAPTSSDIL
jgi:hypothetical protein